MTEAGPYTGEVTVLRTDRGAVAAEVLTITARTMYQCINAKARTGGAVCIAMCSLYACKLRLLKLMNCQKRASQHHMQISCNTAQCAAQH